MNTAKTLKVILIITCIQLLVSVVWPIYIFATKDLGLGALVIGFIFATIIIYYLVYLVFLTRYVAKNPVKPNVSLVIFLNVLPIIIYTLILLLD